MNDKLFHPIFVAKEIISDIRHREVRLERLDVFGASEFRFCVEVRIVLLGHQLSRVCVGPKYGGSIWGTVAGS